MSAWYVKSALGFYQTCPGKDEFTMGIPIFRKIELKLEDGNIIKIIKEEELITKRLKVNWFNNNFKLTNLEYYYNYIKPVNYQTFFKSKIVKFLFQNDTAKTIEVVCGGTKIDKAFIPSPIIISNKENVFYDSILIAIKPVKSNLKTDEFIFYSMNESDYKKFDKPFNISSSCKINSYVFQQNKKSHISTAHFYKRPHNYSIHLNCKYNKQYTADGDDGIIDGQYGDLDFRKGGWQGYQSQNFEAVIDMKELKQFTEISANFLQDTRSWILFPTKVEFYISNDNTNFKLAETIENTIAANDYNVQTQKLKVKTKKEDSNARYIKVKAYNYGKLPEWHAGKGDDAFIFIDEIEVK